MYPLAVQSILHFTAAIYLQYIPGTYHTSSASTGMRGAKAGVTARRDEAPLVMRQGRGSEETEAVFCLQGQKSLFIPGCVQGAIIKYVCLPVSVCVYVLTFVVFTDCESCTRPISTNPEPTEAGEYGLVAWDVFRRTPS